MRWPFFPVGRLTPDRSLLLAPCSQSLLTAHRWQRDEEGGAVLSIHIVWHPATLRHEIAPGHPEAPARLEAIRVELQTAWPRAEPLIWHEATRADDRRLCRVHAGPYLERLEACAAGGGGRLDSDTAMNHHSWEAAVHAAGAAVEAARLALEGQPAFAAVRPPGHHATANRAMGFCLLNNVVVAARTALEEWGLDRVLIVDWDVHHGNGTQALVETDPRIRYVSLHQWPLYPGTGRADERGVGNIFNLPRPPGLAPERYVRDLEAAVAEATDAWVPELLLVSAGFDAMAGDPLAGFTLEPEHYAQWIHAWRRLDVPLASVLEGGYVPRRIARAVVTHLAALVD